MSRRMDCIEKRLAARFFGDNSRREETFRRIKEPLKTKGISTQISEEEPLFMLGEVSGC